MPTLYDWGLKTWDGGVFRAFGYIAGHPKETLSDGHNASTSPIRDAVVVDGRLLLETHSGTLYTLRPEDIHPRLRPDSANPDAWKEALACLSFFGVDPGFLEHCVQARLQADAERRAEAEILLKPGELLLEVVGYWVLNALCRTAEGEVRTIKPTLHGSMFQDSVLITDWEGGTVDFRYFPHRDRLEPYHVSDGLRTIKVRNLGSGDVLFGVERRQVRCPAGEVTAVPAAEHNKEGLLSPDAVNGKGLYQTMLDSGEEKQYETKQ